MNAATASCFATTITVELKVGRSPGKSPLYVCTEESWQQHLKSISVKPLLHSLYGSLPDSIEVFSIATMFTTLISSKPQTTGTLHAS